jgi:hypothetical protein
MLVLLAGRRVPDVVMREETEPMRFPRPVQYVDRTASEIATAISSSKTGKDDSKP